MSSVLRSSIIEIIMLILCIAWAAIFSVSLLHPDMSSLAEHDIPVASQAA